MAVLTCRSSLARVHALVQGSIHGGAMPCPLRPDRVATRRVELLFDFLSASFFTFRDFAAQGALATQRLQWLQDHVLVQRAQNLPLRSLPCLVTLPQRALVV